MGRRLPTTAASPSAHRSASPSNTSSTSSSPTKPSRSTSCVTANRSSSPCPSNRCAASCPLQSTTTRSRTLSTAVLRLWASPSRTLCPPHRPWPRGPIPPHPTHHLTHATWQLPARVGRGLDVGCASGTSPHLLTPSHAISRCLPRSHLLFSSISDAPQDLVHLALTGVQRRPDEQPVILSKCFPSRRTAGYLHMADRQVGSRAFSRLLAPSRAFSRLLTPSHAFSSMHMADPAGGERQRPAGAQPAADVRPSARAARDERVCRV